MLKIYPFIHFCLSVCSEVLIYFGQEILSTIGQMFQVLLLVISVAARVWRIMDGYGQFVL